MSESKRNIAVGLTVLLALLLLCAMVLLFALTPDVLQTGYTIEVHTPSTAGAKAVVQTALMTASESPDQVLGGSGLRSPVPPIAPRIEVSASMFLIR